MANRPVHEIIFESFTRNRIQTLKIFFNHTRYTAFIELVSSLCMYKKFKRSYTGIRRSEKNYWDGLVCK